MPPPTAPMWASNAPTATTVSARKASFAAHSADSVPKGMSDVNVSVPKVSFSAGSLRIQLREERVRRVAAEFGVPQRLVTSGTTTALELSEVIRAGENCRDPSQCSRTVTAASATAVSASRMCVALAQNHSDG